MTATDADLLIGREAMQGALRQLMLGLPAQAPHRVVLLDAELGEWPLDEPAVLDALSTWARPAGRQLQLVTLDFEAMPRQRPRFTAWRRHWAHRVEAWRPSELTGASMPAWLLAGDRAVVWLDRTQWRGRRLVDVAEVRKICEQTDVILQRCEISWAVTTLGL